uniref:DNA topoisomerase (ATP-hydrolyzing) n=1 Tax=Salix viminalis TaxID=40686 RepID=A0A6N2LCB6_SALVM
MMYLNSASQPGSERPKSFYEKVGERWEVCVSLTEGQFQQITNYVMNAVNKKHKNSNIKAHNVKNYLWIAGVAGLSQMERNFYGVFPLRGKLLNVREATTKQLKENKEIECIKKILGLQHDKQYSNVKSL